MNDTNHNLFVKDTTLSPDNLRGSLGPVQKLTRLCPKWGTSTAFALFTEYRPMNVLMAEVKEGMRYASDMGKIQAKAQSVYKRLKTPIILEPNRWWEIMKSVFVDSGKNPR